MVGKHVVKGDRDKKIKKCREIIVRFSEKIN
jgi:hypothetical protein